MLSRSSSILVKLPLMNQLIQKYINYKTFWRYTLLYCHFLYIIHYVYDTLDEYIYTLKKNITNFNKYLIEYCQLNIY